MVALDLTDYHLDSGALTIRRGKGHLSYVTDGSADLATVQTTVRYDRRGEAAKRQAVAVLHVPYEA